jgi:hypothetical protein
MPSWKRGRKKGKPRLKKTARGEALAPDLAAEVERLVGREAAAARDFEAVETAVRREALRFAARGVEQRLNADPGDFTGARRPCSCGQPARSVDRRAQPVQTVLGELRLERASYYCAVCPRGFCPRDQPLGMEDTSLSPGVTRMVGTVGTLLSFQEGRELLGELAGVEVRAQQVERRAEALARQTARSPEARHCLPYWPRNRHRLR